ncbi:MAG TPA: hypothetical protein VGN34_26370, partial [Ktedonobacteraceae bacterium]
GIARFTTTTSSASHSIRGTPTYMAPEQLEGFAVPATDQYALAIMTYELLTGRPPFQGGLGQMMYQHFHAQPAPPSSLNPSLPADVDTVILRALAKKPEERFRSISAFAHAFNMAMNNADVLTARIRDDAIATPDLRAALAISEIEAQRGTRRSLTLPDGRNVEIIVPAGAHDGQLLRLEGLGPASETGRISALLIALAIVPSTAPPIESITSSKTMTVITPSRPSITTQETLASALPAGSYNKPEGPSRGSSRGFIVLTIVLALIISAGSVGFAFYAITTHKQASSPTRNTTTPTTITQTQAGSPTPVMTEPTASTLPDSYTQQGTLVLNDPLQDNSQNIDWMTGLNENNASCAFVGGAYQSSQPINGDFHVCFALTTDYSNFVFETQMTIIAGQAGGVIFRGNQANSTFYYFNVGQDGSYDLRDYIDPWIAHARLLISGSSPAIHAGLNQPNTIAVVANGNIFKFYVNHQMITSVSDSTLSHGQIGIVAYNQGSTATTVFNNVRVWKL